jgi:hypothetical protein
MRSLTYLAIPRANSHPDSVEVTPDTVHYRTNRASPDKSCSQQAINIYV